MSLTITATPATNTSHQVGLVRQWGIPLALYSDRHAAFKYNARQKPVPVETTQFARVMRELGIRQIFALSQQAKGRVERMLETFQDRLATELRLAGASTIDEASLVLHEFLPRFNARFAVAAEQPETAYRRVPDVSGNTKPGPHSRHRDLPANELGPGAVPVSPSFSSITSRNR